MNLLETNSAGRWVPGIGDPTLAGWLIVAAYLAAALLAALAWRAARPAGPRAVARFWLLVGSVLTLLAVNKQLDLQSLLTQVGRDLAKEGGWYQERRWVQVAFIGALCVGALVVLIVALRSLRHHLKEVGLAIAGAVIMMLFVLARAASFHHVDHMLRMGVSGARVNHLLELTGIVLVAIGAWRSWRSRCRE